MSIPKHEITRKHYEKRKKQKTLENQKNTKCRNTSQVGAGFFLFFSFSLPGGGGSHPCSLSVEPLANRLNAVVRL